MFRVFSAVNAATTITVTISGTTGFISWEAAEYSYTGSFTTLDPANATGFNYSVASASGGIATVNSAANTTGSSDMIWGACIAVDTGCTGGAGYTTHDDSGGACQANSGGADL
jgi:hypothetical protein